MRTGYDNNHTGFADFEPSKAVCESDAFNTPTLLCLMNDSLNLFMCHLFVHFIFEIAYLFATCMVTHNTFKNNNASTIGTTHGIYQCISIQGFTGELNNWLHGRSPSSWRDEDEFIVLLQYCIDWNITTINCAECACHHGL